MNLVICPNRTVTIYMLAYIREFGLGEKFSFVILDQTIIPDSLLRIATGLNTEFIALSDASKERYEDLIIHSYCLWSEQSYFLSKLNFYNMAIYSDGSRNGFYGLIEPDLRLKKLIYFGFELEDETFIANLPKNGANLIREVVSESMIQKVWTELVESRKSSFPDVFEPEDLLLVMRYWGMPGAYYPFNPGMNIKAYLEQELSDIAGIKRVIYRADERFDHKISRSDLADIFGKGVEVVMWEELFTPDLSFSEISSPEGVLREITRGPGWLFAFDSSLNILSSISWPNTRIVWPSRDNFKEFFLLKRSVDVVSEQLTWMQNYHKMRSGPKKSTSKIYTRGQAVEQVLTALMLQTFYNKLEERHALTHERDALTHERDALTHERDALTHERDALTNSTIWRLTEPLRKIRNILKN